MYALKHIPSNTVCDVDGNLVWVWFAVEEEGRAHINKVLSNFRADYEVIPFPEHLTPGFDSNQIRFLKARLDNAIKHRMEMVPGGEQHRAQALYCDQLEAALNKLRASI